MEYLASPITGPPSAALLLTIFTGLGTLVIAIIARLDALIALFLCRLGTLLSRLLASFSALGHWFSPSEIFAGYLLPPNGSNQRRQITSNSTPVAFDRPLHLNC